ncbi:hypothetical protein N9381_05610 [Paracoccaceae bacterium]|nr:hypothetical protein [Paracoccaceae bacterium]
MIQIRPAILQDAEGISRVLTAIIVSWNSDRACDPAYVTSHYIAAADQMTCTVALDLQRHGMVLGFQSLKLAQAGKVSVSSCLTPPLPLPNRLVCQT